MWSSCFKFSHIEFCNVKVWWMFYLFNCVILPINWWQFLKNLSSMVNISKMLIDFIVWNCCICKAYCSIIFLCYIEQIPTLYTINYIFCLPILLVEKMHSSVGSRHRYKEPKLVLYHTKTCLKWLHFYIHTSEDGC